MSIPENLARDVVRVSRDWWLFMLLGVLMIMAGVIAIFSPLVSGVAITGIIGVLFLIRAGVHLIDVIRSHKGVGNIVMGLIITTLYAVAGILILRYPLRGLVTLTVVLGMLYILGGLFRTVLALEMVGKPTWGWMLVGGLLSLLLGIIIFAGLPISILWAVGIIVGVDLIFFGWTLVAQSIAVHTLGQAGMRLAGQH
jgi:uncharacterized membrane protein HdeD (DUF308 family)